MIIDAHLHLRDDVYVGEEGSPENLVGLMDRAGVDKAVVFKIWCATGSSIEAGEQAAREYPDRLIPFVYVVPDFEKPVLPRLERALGGGVFRGLKIHTGAFRPVGYLVDPVLELAARHSVPCLVDFRGDLASAERLAREFPAVRLIIAHLGKYLCNDEGLMDQFISLAEAHPNVFLDVSGVVMLWKIGDAVRRAGAGRVIWGTDGPRKPPDTLRFARMELDKVDALNLDPEAKQDLLGRNIARLLSGP